MKDIAIYGAGGYGREIACLINQINQINKEWELIGFFDDGLPIGQANEYGKVLGGINELNSYTEELSIAMAIGNPKILQAIVSKITNTNINFPNIIAPDTLFFDENNIKLGIGNVIGFRSVISCNVCIGNYNNFNTDVFLGHDVIVGNYNMFNPSVRISGEVLIGDANFFGVSSIVLQQKTIGCNITLVANSVVMRKVKDNTTYIGNPAVELKY